MEMEGKMLDRLLKFAAELTALCRNHELNVRISHFGGGDPELLVEPDGEGWYVVTPDRSDEGGVISYWRQSTTWVVHRRQERETGSGLRPMRPVTSAPTLEAARALVEAESPGVTWRDEDGRYLYLDDGVVRETPPRLVWGDVVDGNATWLLQAQ